MRTSSYPLLALALALGCTPPASRTESDSASCSNGRDDDGDTLIDCADLACTVFPFCARDAGVLDAGADAPSDAPLPEGGLDAPVCTAPLDVVLVLDVSGTMDRELAAFRDATGALFATAQRLDPSAQISLVAFVDDVLLVNGCTPFATAEALRTAIEAFRVTAPMNRNVADPALPNRDCPENSLDALFEAAARCPLRNGSTRVFVHATDDTFLERPGVLSGEWGGGVFVASLYSEVQNALTSRNIHFSALAWSGAGEFCGAGSSPDVGRGFHADFGALPSLPVTTDGADAVVWDARGLGTTVDLSVELPALLVRRHPCD